MSESPQAALRSSRLKFLALVALFAAPVLGATGWYFFGTDLARPAIDAHGELLDPVAPLSDFNVATLARDGNYDLETLRGHWTLVHVIDGPCGDRCRERIYYTRQIREALGHDRVRVRRLAVVMEGAPAVDFVALLPGHSDLQAVRGGEGLARQLPGERTEATVFLVDPLGNLMMRFDPEVGAQGILGDLKQLLRVSRIG